MRTTQENIKLTTKQKIIEHIALNKSITRDELASLIGVSANSIKQHLANLKKDGIIERVGSTKSGYWKVIT
jgi:predicted HTH transcriptional regulator